MEKNLKPHKMNTIEIALAQVKNKSKLCRTIAEEFKMQPTSVRTNWIYNLSIPSENLDRVLEIINDTIKEQA
jgi:hypothetical protein